MTEIGQPDLSRLLQSKRNEFSSIVTSRKRKLRELFAVATHANTLPQDAFADPDAPTPTQAEWQFLQANDVSQGRKLNENTLPQRQKLSLESFKQSFLSQVSLQSGKNPSIFSTDSPNASASHITISKTASTSSSTSNLSARKKPLTAHASTHAPFSSVTLTNAIESEQKPLKEVSTVTISREPHQDAYQDTSAASRTEKSRLSTQVTHPSRAQGSPQVTNHDIEIDPTQSHTAKREPPSRPNVNSSRTQNTMSPVTSATEPARAAEVPSSPDSPAPSAPTPAIHEASTDTSPEHDVSQIEVPSTGNSVNSTLQQRGDKLLSSASTAVEAAPSASEDGPGASNTAENQLLQESLRSNRKASPPIKGVSDPQVNDGLSVAEPQLSAELQPGKPATRVSVTKEFTEAQPLSAPLVARKKSCQQDDFNQPNLESIVPVSTPMLASQDNAGFPERAVTRVSSGAMRLKSVSEIVGEGSRNHNTVERRDFNNHLTRLIPVAHTPVHRTKTLTHRRDRSKSHASTVLFGKQPRRNHEKSWVTGPKAPVLPADDYFTPLFLQGFAGGSSWMQPIDKILFHANKTITSPDISLALQDSQACKILRRVYSLQQQDKWSLRQPKRCSEPARHTSHWDTMLREVKWMRTDFREERKWKRAVAKNLAYACAHWCNAGPEDRKAMQIPSMIPRSRSLLDEDVLDGTVDEHAETHPTPDLVSSADADSLPNVDDLADDFADTIPPSTIFTLQEDEVIFRLRRTVAADQLLDELPMYGAPLEKPKSGALVPELDPDAHWKRPALPLSKYVESRMQLEVDGPPRKKSRFNHATEDSDDESETEFIADRLVRRAKLAPETDEVALFHPEQKHIRDRLHAGHQFRPPSEHPMPSQAFFESRNASQWTVSEDDELRALVREYSYNWALISSLLSTRSAFNSGAERRTPWECFERWTGLEGLPNDLQKTQYFKSYNGRIENAQRLIAAQNQAAVQAAQANGLTPIRRRQSTPVRVERRRNQKHLTMIDAMRKLAKKRETALQKQQHNASQNSHPKKVTESVSRGPPKTPRDYSLLRWERDQALADKMAQYAQRQEVNRRATLQARAQNQAQMAAAQQAQAHGNANGQQVAANVVNGTQRGNFPSQGGAAVASGQGRPRIPMQAMSNGMGQNSMPPMNGTLAHGGQMSGQHPQMQGAQAQQRIQQMTNQQQANAQMMMQAHRLQEQQRIAQLQPGHAQNGVPLSSSSGLNGPQEQQQQASPPLRNGNSIPASSPLATNQLLMAGLNGNNSNLGVHTTQQVIGMHTPSGLGPGSNGSPGVRTGHHAVPPTILAQLNQLEATFRAKNPTLTPDQARQLATEHLTRAMVAQRHNAMNSAAGNTGQQGAAAMAASTPSPHQYAALLRQQQQAQQQAQQHGQHPQPQRHHHQQQQQQQQAQQVQQHPRVQMSTSPVPIPAQPQMAHRQSSGSATPSAGGK